MKKKFKVGVIGCGGIATWHVKGIMDSPDLEIGALCDIVPAKLEEKKRQCGASDDMLYADYIEMLDSGKIDAVDICTPNYLHFPMAMEAVKRNIPYSVEKPVCNSKEDALTLYEATKAKNLPNMVCFSYRFIAAARYARDLVRNGSLGKIYHVSGEYFQGYGFPNPKSGVVGPLTWRFDKELAGSGALGDLGCHMIDLIRFISGREFTKITADADTFVSKRPVLGDGIEYGSVLGDVYVDDYINMAGQLEDQIAASLSISRFAYGRGNYQRIEVYGNCGGLRYTLEDGDRLEINIGNEPMRNSHIWTGVPIPGHYHSNQAQSFADILNGCGDGLAADIKDGWQTQRVIDAALAASNSAKAII